MDSNQEKYFRNKLGKVRNFPQQLVIFEYVLVEQNVKSLLYTKKMASLPQLVEFAT